MRGHWGIEHQCHWHLHVTWAERACRCCRDHAPHNIPALCKLVMSLLPRGETPMSLRHKRNKTARDDDFLLLSQVLAQLGHQPETASS